VGQSLYELASEKEQGSEVLSLNETGYTNVSLPDETKKAKSNEVTLCDKECNE
jgi:hypothetical protein